MPSRRATDPGSDTRHSASEREPRPLSERFVASVLESLEAELGGAEACDVVYRGEHSNDLAEVHLTDGRILMLKRARHLSAGPRFDGSRLAAALLRDEAGLVAPVHLDLPRRLSDRPLLAYWRIPLQTLKQQWSELDGAARAVALRDWGRLTRRIHEVRLPGNGRLLEAARTTQPLSEFLMQDLEGRLGSALEGVWPAAVDLVERLIAGIPTVAARVGDGGGVLVHNDLHLPNVLCDVTDGAPRCVGVLDLEDAIAGPAEADLAKTEVLHGPLFRHQLKGAWLERVYEGYGVPLDTLVLTFFRAYHLVNMGFHAVLVGYTAHAEDVARAAREDAVALDRADDGAAHRRL